MANNNKKLRLRRYLKGKTFVFIDAANLFYSQRTMKWKIDYAKLTEYLRSELEIVDVYFYSGKTGNSEKQKSFLKKLREKIEFFG